MKIDELLEQRQSEWMELEQLCDRLSGRGAKLAPDQVLRFATLYRNACADLSLAEAWHLPPTTIGYLQGLVARAHHRLYRARNLDFRRWLELALLETPRQIFAEPAVHIAALVFWGLAFLSGYLAWNQSIWPDFAEQVLGTQTLQQFEEMYADFEPEDNGSGARSSGTNFSMAGFYIWNNAGIGLQCFASMVLILPGFVTLAFNAVHLGAVDGYMLRSGIGDAGIHFRNFTTAHGPLELTAIVLSAGAGLKIGLGWFWSRGFRRIDGLMRAGRESLPIILCAVVMFILAALVEGFLSPLPSRLLPWWTKGLVALVTSTLMMFYFVVLGFPRAKP